MATRYHIGAKSLRGQIAAYSKRFDLLEVVAALEEPPAKKGSKAREHGGVAGPSPATLKKWRKAVPPHFEFSVVAGPEVSRVKHTPELEAELEAAKQAMNTLQARCFVLRTTPEVTPAQVWRDRMAKLFDRLPRDVNTLVWEASGLWEHADAAAFAKKLGVVLAVDAAKERVPGGAVAYVRLRALGETRSFSPTALERIAENIGERRDAYVVIETESALDEAKRLRGIVQRSRATTHGGLGRLVRPRGGIVVRDDEQE